MNHQSKDACIPGPSSQFDAALQDFDAAFESLGAVIESVPERIERVLSPSCPGNTAGGGEPLKPRGSSYAIGEIERRTQSVKMLCSMLRDTLSRVEV